MNINKFYLKNLNFYIFQEFLGFFYKLKLFWELADGLADETSLFWGGEPSHWVVSVSVHVGHQNRSADQVDSQPVGGLQNVTDGVHDETANFSSEIKHVELLSTCFSVSST